MTASAPPTLPWQITGNHWIALPCIHPADASIHAIGVVHRGARAAIELAGSPGFAEGQGKPLLKPILEIGGVRHELSAAPIAWERALGWIPTFSCTIGSLVVRGTIFAPYGRDADVSGAIYALSLENRSSTDTYVGMVLEGALGHRQLRVRTPRPIVGEIRVDAMDDGIIAIEGTEVPSLMAMAIAGDTETESWVEGRAFRLRRRVTLAAGGSTQLAYYIAVGPERDGAIATANVLRRRGWRDLLAATRYSVSARAGSSTT
jgi:hypothetical protein